MARGKHSKPDYSTPLTDDEYEQMKKDHAKLQDAWKANPEAVEQAMKDFVDFPPKSGDLKD